MTTSSINPAINKIKRLANKADYTLQTAFDILDSNTLCHIAFVDNDRPMSIPMAYWRIGDNLYFHSANKGRFEKATTGKQICVSVARTTGFVLARSGFEHTYNYESVVIHGVSENVDDPVEKEALLKAFIEGLYPNRWDQLKAMKASELRGTRILRLPIETFACKLRAGAPDDKETDGDINVWAGHIPIHQSLGDPVQDGDLNVEVSLERLQRFES